MQIPKMQIPKMLILTALLAIAAGLAVASEEIAEREELECAECHEPPESETLNDKGKYYELMGSLDGFDEVAAAFEQCTYCHVGEAGSSELTPKGQTFAFAVMDMEGLRQWLRSEHPGMGALDEAEKQGPEEEERKDSEESGSEEEEPEGDSKGGG